MFGFSEKKTSLGPQTPPSEVRHLPPVQHRAEPAWEVLHRRPDKQESDRSPNGAIGRPIGVGHLAAQSTRFLMSKKRVVDVAGRRHALDGGWGWKISARSRSWSGGQPPLALENGRWSLPLAGMNGRAQEP